MIYSEIKIKFNNSFLFKYAAILLISCFVLNSCEKDVVETGYLVGIVSNEMGQPIDGAMIEIETLSTKTNSNGEYNFDKLEANEYIIIVSKENYIKKTATIKISKNQVIKQNFTLTSENSFLDISETLKNLNPLSGFFDLNIFSNSEWKILKKSNWLSFSPESGVGNKLVRFSYQANDSLQNRIDTVQIISNSIIKTLLVKRNVGIHILRYKGILDLDPDIGRDSVYIVFNKPIIIERIVSNSTLCFGVINYLHRPNECTFKFRDGCAHFLKQHSYTISVRDDDGNKYSNRIDVPFFMSREGLNLFLICK